MISIFLPQFWQNLVRGFSSWVNLKPQLGQKAVWRATSIPQFGQNLDFLSVLTSIVSSSSSAESSITSSSTGSSSCSSMTGTSFTTTAMLYYSPINDMKLGMGPVLTFKTFDENPTISLKLSATLGGGKF